MSEELQASALLRWPGPTADLEPRRALGARAAERVEDGQLIGIGPGITASLALWAIGARASERGLDVTVACTSYETETVAQTLGLKLAQLGGVEPDWGVDGVDEVAPDQRLLASRGAGLLRQKLLWNATRHMYLAVEPAAFVDTLGRTRALPVEVHPDAVREVARELQRLGAADAQLRLSTGKDGPLFTESGNLLLDVRFPELTPGLAAQIKALAGVIETGLFEGYSFELV